MSITAVPISMRLVGAPIAASSGNGEASWRAKWWTRTYAPSSPSSSAASASSIVCTSASRAVLVWESGAACQWPNERKPIRVTRPDGSDPLVAAGRRSHAAGRGGLRSAVRRGVGRQLVDVAVRGAEVLPGVAAFDDPQVAEQLDARSARELVARRPDVIHKEPGDHRGGPEQPRAVGRRGGAEQLERRAVGHREHDE